MLKVEQKKDWYMTYFKECTRWVVGGWGTVVSFVKKMCNLNV